MSESEERRLLREWQALYRIFISRFAGSARIEPGGLVARTDALLSRTEGEQNAAGKETTTRKDVGATAIAQASPAPAAPEAQTPEK